MEKEGATGGFLLRRGSMRAQLVQVLEDREQLRLHAALVPVRAHQADTLLPNVREPVLVLWVLACGGVQVSGAEC